MKLSFKGVFSINGRCHFSEENEHYKFIFPIENSSPVEIKIITLQKEIHAIQEVIVKPHIHKTLVSGTLEGVGKKHREELTIITNDLIESTKKLVYGIKAFFNWSGLSEHLISSKGIFWSEDRETWNNYPREFSTSASTKPFIFLNSNTSSYIQDYIDGKLWEPFLALGFLDKAKEENNTIFKWINATIAAELAIKEFYIKYDGKFEKFIFEVPSPPLHKLYGTILESFIGEKSPMVKQIEKGVTLRNSLVHKPSKHDIDPDKANQYVEDIEIAIFHLLSHLYPNDPIINHRLNPIIKINRS